MEPSVGSKKSFYGMLMTVLFYTTGFICSLRTALWLTMHALIPAISHTIALYYHPSSSSPSKSAPPSPGGGGPGFPSNVGKGAGDAAGLLFKLVHTAAGHNLLVPVPVPASMYHISAAAAGSAGSPGRTFTGLALSSLAGAGSVAAYYYLVRKRTLNRLATLFVVPVADAVFAVVQCGPSAWTWSKITRSISAALRRQRHSPSSAATETGSSTETESSVPVLATTFTARCAKTKLNPAAPAFTPSPAPALTSSPALPPLRRLDPTARTFAPRGCATPPSPADSTYSAGPATPSPSCVPSAFALAAARVARAGTGMGKSGGADGSAGVHIPPVGVGKMRVVRPEEVIVGERRAGEVFVFF